MGKKLMAQQMNELATASLTYQSNKILKDIRKRASKGFYSIEYHWYALRLNKGDKVEEEKAHTLKQNTMLVNFLTTQGFKVEFTEKALDFKCRISW